MYYRTIFVVHIRWNKYFYCFLNHTNEIVYELAFTSILKFQSGSFPWVARTFFDTWIQSVIRPSIPDLKHFWKQKFLKLYFWLTKKNDQVQENLENFWLVFNMKE